MTSNASTQSIGDNVIPYQQYNYHEYFVHPEEYASQMSYLQNPNFLDKQGNCIKKLEIPEKPVLVCHFPNSYVDPTSIKFRQTRIVRIPREYQTYGDLVPQFSVYYPGNEPGALHSLNWELRQSKGKTPKNGLLEERSWMTPAYHPLELYISPSELDYIVKTVNSILKEAFWPYTWKNAVETFVQILTCFTAGYIIHLIINISSMLSSKPQAAKHSLPLSNTSTKSRGDMGGYELNSAKGRFRTKPLPSAHIIDEFESTVPIISKYPSNMNWQLQRLEEFIRDVNLKLEGKVRFISPFRSAYLSLDIEIPSPIPGEQYEE